MPLEPSVLVHLPAQNVKETKHLLAQYKRRFREINGQVEALRKRSIRKSIKQD